MSPMPGSLGLSMGCVAGDARLALACAPPVTGMPVSSSRGLGSYPGGSTASPPPPTLMLREQSCPVACGLAVRREEDQLCVTGCGAGLLTASCVRSSRPGAGLGQGRVTAFRPSQNLHSPAVQHFPSGPARRPACLHPFSRQVSPRRAGLACALLEGSSACGNRLL